MIHASLLVAIVYSSLIAIAQFSLQHSIGGLFYWLGERTFSSSTPGIALTNFQFSIFNFQLIPFNLRAYGTFPHPNVLGGFLAVTLPIIIQYTNNPIIQLSNVKKIFQYAVILFGCLALFLTFSRSAWVVGAAGIVFAFVAKQKRESRITNYELWKYAGILLIIIVLYSLFIIHNSSEESVVVRQLLNSSAIAIWKQHPWFGVGLGNFLVALPASLPSKFIYFLQPVHNIYLLLLSEVGIVGVGVILLMLYFLLNYESGIVNYGKQYKASRKFPVIHYSFFAILLLGLVDHYPLTLQQGQLLFTIILGFLFI